MRITAHVQQELEWELEASFTVLEQDASAMPSLVDLHAKAVESALTFAEQCAAYVDDPDKMLDVLAITVKLEQLLAASSLNEMDSMSGELPQLHITSSMHKTRLESVASEGITDGTASPRARLAASIQLQPGLNAPPERRQSKDSYRDSSVNPTFITGDAAGQAWAGSSDQRLLKLRDALLVSASLALLAGDTSAPHSASLGAVIDGADNVSKPWVHGDGGSSPPQHTFSIHAHACSDPSLAYPDHPFSAAAAQLGPASLQASASQPTFSSITASLDEVVLSYASRHCCAAAMHCVLWYAEVLRRRSTLGRLSAFTKARLASLQAWLLKWYKRLLTRHHPLYAVLAADMGPLFGGLWVHMAAGDVQQLVAHVRHNIRPLAYFDLPGLGPGNVHGMWGDPSALSAVRMCLLFIPDRGWPGWLSVEEGMWKALLQEMRGVACTGQASQLSQRLGDLLVSAAHSAPPAVALAWCRTLVEHGVDANHVAHVHGEWGITSALHGACRRQLVDLAQLLMAAGAHPGLQDHRGEDAVMVAARQRCLPILAEFERLAHVSLSIRLGGCVSKSGDTALMVAAAAGYVDVCEWLLAAMASLEPLDSVRAVVSLQRACDGATALLLSAQEGHSGVVELILDGLGTEVGQALANSCQSDGWGALSAAAARGHGEVVHMCLSLGKPQAPALLNRALLEAERVGNTEIAEAIKAYVVEGVGSHRLQASAFRALPSLRGLEAGWEPVDERACVWYHHTPAGALSGRVFKGLQFWSEDREMALSTRVVVKRVEAESPEAHAELANELAVLTRHADMLWDHPHLMRLRLPPIHRDGCVFLVMERYAGDLEGMLPSLVAKGALRQVLLGAARGVGALHAVGMVHRDIKPTNILIDGSGTAKISDFGISCPSGTTLCSNSNTSGDSGSCSAGSSTGSSQGGAPTKGAGGASPADGGAGLQTNASSNAIISATSGQTGCLPHNHAAQRGGWSSPEQMRGDAAAPASDVFSLGVCFYWAATGHHPFGDTTHEREARIRAHKLDLSGLSLSSEPEMSLLVAAMLQHDPASRPTIQQVLAHPYFGAGWQDPEEFWGTLTKWASEGDDASFAGPTGKLWFWESGADLLFDCQTLLGCDNWVKAITESPSSDGSGSGTGGGSSAAMYGTGKNGKGNKKTGSKAGARVLSAAASKSVRLPTEFWGVARREYNGRSLQHLLEFMNNTYKHMSENARSLAWDVRARMPFRDHASLTTFLFTHFPLATLLVHALLCAHNPAAPPPILRTGAATRRNLLTLTTPERYQSTCTFSCPCAMLFFKRFRNST